MRGSILKQGQTRMGRRPRGVGPVDSVKASRQAKERTKTLLRLLAGDLTRDQAAEAMGVSVRRVRQLRDEMLASAVAALEPGQPGRPRKCEPSAAERRVAELEAAEKMLRWEIEVSGVREELALVMPHLVRGDAGASTVGARGKTRASRTSRTKGAAGSKGLRD